MTLYIGNAPVYTQGVSFVPYELPFTVYRIRTPLGVGEINVNNIYLSIFPEHLAVAMTAWGNIREHFGTRRMIRVCGVRYEKFRDAFIEAVEFEKRW